MSDPFDALRAPVVPEDPDAAFAAALRARLERAVLDPRGTTVSSTPTDTAEFAWPATVTPYIGVLDGLRAIEWYVEVFAAERRGEPYVMEDGTVGHAEIGIGDAVLMLAGGAPGTSGDGPPGDIPRFSIHVQVPDVDATVERAVAAGAELVRAPGDQPYGRTGVIRDPFGHRWIVQTPPGRATRTRHGDIGYVTIGVPDTQRAKDFYAAVLGWRFSAGSVEDGWQAEGPTPPVGMWGGADAPEVQLCYRVADITAAVARVRAQGGEAAEPERKPYGQLAECTDDQGIRFQLWEPADG
ncbi:VOC family protein [soil metagenome]